VISRVSRAHGASSAGFPLSRILPGSVPGRDAGALGGLPAGLPGEPLADPVAADEARAGEVAEEPLGLLVKPLGLVPEAS
jgi:hypothetical protein